MNLCHCERPATLYFKLVRHDDTQASYACCDSHIMAAVENLQEAQGRLGGTIESRRDNAIIDTALKQFHRYQNLGGSEKLHVLVLAVLQTLKPTSILTAKYVADIIGESQSNARNFLERPRLNDVVERYTAVAAIDGTEHPAYRIKTS